MGLKENIRSLSLMPSARGAFEVVVNGKTLHSKLRTGDFPDFEAILKAVKSMC